MVQHIPYDWSKFDSGSKDWYYPYETLYERKGLCGDKSLLMAYVLEKLGYDVVLFQFQDTPDSGHMAVGIRCTEPYDVEEPSVAFDFENTGYAFVETTSPSIITYVPDTYYGGYTISATPGIIHVGTGTQALDVRDEYRDAQTLSSLEAMGPVLDSRHYAQWQHLCEKYDLDVET
jgi:arylamine N-acetyltransferase